MNHSKWGNCVYRKSLLKREKSYLSNWLKTMAFKIDGCKKIISDWHFVCTCNTTSSIRLLFQKNYLRVLSFPITVNSPVWVIIPCKIHSTLKTNFSNCKGEFNEKTLLWDNSKFQIYSNSLKSIRSWIHTHMSYDLTLLLIHSNTFSENLHHSLPNQK